MHTLHSCWYPPCTEVSALVYVHALCALLCTPCTHMLVPSVHCSKLWHRGKCTGVRARRSCTCVHLCTDAVMAHTSWHPPCTEVSALVYVHRGRVRECTEVVYVSALVQLGLFPHVHALRALLCTPFPHMLAPTLHACTTACVRACVYVHGRE